MAKTEIEEIGETLTSLAKPAMKPRDLLKAVRRTHPKASRKTIVRAAFYSLIANAGKDPERDRQLQDFALSERGED